MAVPSSFDESNAVLSKPEAMSDDECSALCVLLGQTESGLPVVVSCWKLTREELEEINKTGRIWLTLVGQTMPPAMLNTKRPF